MKPETSPNTATSVAGPATLVLTEQGTSWFVHRNQRLQRFRLISGREEYGLQLRDFRVSALESTIAQGLVQVLQYPVVDAFAGRKALLDVVGTSLRGFLRSRASDRFARQLEGSALMRSFNRQHPENKIGDARRASALTRFLEGKRDALVRVRSLVATRVLAEFRSRAETGLDRDALRARIDRLLIEAPAEAWALLMIEPPSDDRSELIERLAQSVLTTLEREELADYVALVWAEVIAYVQLCSECDPPPVQLLIEFGPSGQSNNRGRLHMMAATGDVRLDVMRRHLDDIGVGGTDSRQSFEQFYQSAGTGAGHAGNLGLYYLNFLEDACDRVGVPCRSYVRGARADGRFYVSLTL